MALSMTLLTLGAWLLLLRVTNPDDTYIYNYSFMFQLIIVTYALLGVVGKAILRGTGDESGKLSISGLVQFLCLLTALIKFYFFTLVFALIAESLTFYFLKMQGVSRKNRLLESSANLGFLFWFLNLPACILGFFLMFQVGSEIWLSLVPLCMTQTVTLVLYTNALAQIRASFQGDRTEPEFSL